MKKIFSIIISIIILVVIFFTSTSNTNLTSLSSNESIIKEIPLGNTGYKATSTLYKSTATTNPNIRVYITNINSNLYPKLPNIYIADNSTKINIAWLNEELVIYSNTNPNEIFLKKCNFKNIKVRYEQY